ncbi:MAG: 30S ribosomal protein S6 [Lachnospiraceae bacterium]|nr:30S ribosomal protein S6 [Lachnospiraceae bacterium]
MNKYELAVVVSGKLDDEAAAAVVDGAKALVERFGGEVKSVDSWGRKRFAYVLHKQKDGFYSFVKFEAESTVPAEIEKRMRIMENVERYLIVSDDDEVHLGAPVDEEPEGERTELRSSASRAEEKAAPAEEAPAEDAGDSAEEAAPEVDEAPEEAQEEGEKESSGETAEDEA